MASRQFRGLGLLKYRSILLIMVTILVIGALHLIEQLQAGRDTSGVTRLSWATSAVGSAGHRAKIGLMGVLSRELPGYQIEVMPTSGALASMRGFALGQFDGFYGADIAFRELAGDTGRFKGFRPHVLHEPLQSFWTYTLEVGIAIRRQNLSDYSGWSDLDGRVIFTGPAAWDVRSHLELALDALGITFRYRELDLGLTGGMLSSGRIDAFVAYTAGQRAPAAWVSEAAMSADIALLNPSPRELESLSAAGFEIATVDAGVFRTDVGVNEAFLLPFHYGFHVGMNISAEDVYRMLRAIESNATELASADGVFTQIALDMPGVQRRGVAATIESARVHPGLARYMRERGVWDERWNNRIAGNTP